MQELHAICFIMPSDKSKLKPNFERQIHNLLALFPKTATKNVYFFFTFLNSTFFTSGDKKNSMEEIIATFKATNNAEIPFGPENVLCIDSEIFMYFMGIKEQHVLQNPNYESIQISWNKSKNALNKFLMSLKAIKSIKSIDIQKIFDLEQIAGDSKNEKELAEDLSNFADFLDKAIAHNSLKMYDSSFENTYKYTEIAIKKTLECLLQAVKTATLKEKIINFMKKYYDDIESAEEHLSSSKFSDRNTTVPSTDEVHDNFDLYKHEAFTFPKRITSDSNNISTNSVGIDLGTSRCCVAVNRKEGIVTVALENTGERLLPSYVGYDEENPKCGQVVVNRLRNYSEATVFDSKRMIGKRMVVVDKMWPFKVINSNDQVLIKLKTQRGEIQRTATEVAAELLKHMKTKTEEFQGKPLSKVVITVPAAFTKSQEEATRDAAILAGWKDVTLLPEPIAASFAYFVDRPIPNNSNLLLFDLGGGTLDVCVFKINNDQIQIISKNGDLKLGGRDFDNLLMDYFLNKLSLDYKVTKLGNKKYKLLSECQKIKHNLSVRNDDELDVDEIDPTKTGFIKITRQNFNDLSEDLLNKIQNTIFSALYKSKYSAVQIDKVLQVGGGCRMPMIKALLKNIFPNAEDCCEEHPDEVVAIGAAYYANNIFSNN